MALHDNSSRWQWRWLDMCGPDGLELWSSKQHDLGLCFQQLCLQIPVFTIFAVASAFFFGSHVNFVLRSKAHLYTINARCACVVLLAILPILQLYAMLENGNDRIENIFYFLLAVESFSWLSHLGYSFALKTRFGLSARGPVIMCFLWTLLAVLHFINLRSNVLLHNRLVDHSSEILINYIFSILKLTLQICYALTLIPNEGSTAFVYYNQHTETDPLLSQSTAYYRFGEEIDPNYLGMAMEGNNWFSKLLFYWVNPLMKKGVDGKINQPDDLFDLPMNLNTFHLSKKLHKALQAAPSNVGLSNSASTEAHASQSSGSQSTADIEVITRRGNIKQGQMSLLRALHRCFGLQFYSIGALKFVADCSGFAGPILLNKLVGFIEDRSEDVAMGYLYAFGLFSTSLLASFAVTHFNFLISLLGLKIRASVVTAIYRKTLTVSGTTLNSAFSVGEIVNFMSTDTDRIVNSAPSFHTLWSIPFQISVSLFLLYRQVGTAFLAGVGFTILLIPINKVIANKIGTLSARMMERKDKRVKIMTELLRGIRTIKIHVWEDHFQRLVTKLRDEELKYLKGRKYLDALCVYFWATTPVIISLLTFGTYIWMGNELTAATVFTSIALMNMLIGPLNAFPWVLNGLTEAWVSVKRIQKLLDLADLDPSEYYGASTATATDDHDNAVIIKGGGFNWGKTLTAKEKENLHNSKRQHQTLKNKGKGKASTAAALMRANLSSGSHDDLPSDFHLNDIDLDVRTGEFVGVMGSVGSGKSSLISAIMAELLINHGEIIVADLTNGFGYVSQQPWLQRGTIRDNILFGKTFDENKYFNVLYACCLQEDLASLPNRDLTGVGEGGITLSGGQKARIALARAIYQDKQVYLLDDVLSAVDPHVAKHIFQHCILGILKTKTVVLCTHLIQYFSHADKIIVLEHGRIKQIGKPKEVLSSLDDLLPIDLELGQDSLTSASTYLDSIRTDDINESDSVLNEESGETGTVAFNVYGAYWKAIGHILSLCIFLAIGLMQSSRNLTDWWLSYWVTNVSGNDTNITVRMLYYKDTVEHSVNYYMGVYLMLAILNSVATLFRAFLFAYGGINAATSMHKLLLKSVLKSKVQFFDISPLGRILNRFSSDTYTVDDSLPFILNILLAQIFGLLGCVIITIYGLPWLCLILVPLIPIYHWIQNHYRLTSRELKRLSSTTLSPIYSHFNETLQGLSTIRAFRTTKRFMRCNEDTIEMNQKAQFAAAAASQWLGLRLQFIGVALVSGVGLIAVVQHQFDQADPGFVGLAISYALSITGLLNGVVNAFTETEREMIAVERVKQYHDEIAPETVDFIMDPPYAWPSQGVVQFNDVVLKYREHLAPSLKSISFETRPAEKIGIVGRTGAGKSSILAALFRLTELTSGAITIDTVNISHISLAALRSRLSCIPQEPFLYSGTIRDNLDPLGEFRDAELWSALTKVNMAVTVKQLGGGLLFLVESGGMNFSVGQRQLFCLARALLHNAKILCIDEATANVDQATDRQIQQTLRSSFRRCTVITIAHRVQTVLDCDRVLVMGEGEVLEFDTPQLLLDDELSHFYRLVNE